VDKLTEWVELEKRRRELKEELAQIEERQKELEEPVMDFMAQMGLERVRINGMTVYIRRELWAGAVDGDYEKACKALKEAGLGDYVQERFNTQSLSAYIREADKEEGGWEANVPPVLRDAIKVTEKFRLQARKS